MIARKIIDARTPQARDMRLRKATVGMDGKIIEGEDVLSRNRVTVPDAPRVISPRPTFMPDLLAQQKANQTPRNDSQVTAYRDTLRRQQDGDRVRGVVEAEKMKQQQRRDGTAPAEVVDMRPSGMKPSADGNPRGMAYLNNLAGVFREQGAAARVEAATGTPRDYSKAGVDYAKNEAERRANTMPKVSVPANTTRAVLTDPKYGGTGVAYATRTPRVNPLSETSTSTAMRDINRQISRGLAMDVTTDLKRDTRMQAMPPATKPNFGKPSLPADAMITEAAKKRTRPSPFAIARN